MIYPSIKLLLIASISSVSYLAYAEDVGPVVNEDSSALDDQDDIYSLAALKKIQLNQLKINALASQPVSVKDPLQPLNRKIFTFNDTLDQYVLRPVAVQYQAKVPEDARSSYTNFRTNLREPWNAVNQILQGKPKTAAKSLSRFTINTLTSLGFADTAKRLKMDNEKDDLGITLGVWGVSSGPYIMLPFLGPSTFRDGAATIADRYANVQQYVFDDDRSYWANNAIDAINTRAQLLSVESMLHGDKYSAIRDTYLQQRAYVIATKRGEDIESTMFADDPFEDTTDEQDDLPDDAQQTGE
ncbi:VacJ family lipoprotein [Acinetobacter puyangensis]|uniref:Phospholipid-binding lipoprotein MlaA n=1 Tax=Acinetobacter puyangensis TaxID=1096779 RepID=A0A240EEM2_9GAMM|nr:VacJ family lipoprotein [Acinetobacter puyangensis]SNX46981.1 phospholipid-binding lipoprotein MlaA [Acinetobacter puyangensis]